MNELVVYIDESGNTGDVAGDAPFRQQPTFAVVGLVEVSGSGSAATVLAELRKKHRLQGAEVKSKSIHERPDILTDLITGLSRHGVTPFVELMDKRSYVANNIVTYVLGADWFDPSSRVTDELANALAEVIPTLGDDMLAAYSRFAKTPTRELCDAFLISLRRALRAALVRPCTNTERQKALIFAEVASARAIEVAQEPGFACERFLQDPDESRGGYRLGLLPHVQAFANLLARLNRFSRRAGRVRLMHDEQKQFDHVLRDCFARMTSNAFSAALESSVANERAGVDWNFTPGKFDLSFVDSKDHAGVQAADIIAGFCVRRLNEVINGGHPDSRFDEATLMLSSVESKAGLNFVTTNERRLAFWAERREEAAQSTASGEQGKGSMPRWRHWMPLEHECGCVVDWGCDANQSEELAASFMPAAAPFPCPWHGSASGQSATAPAEGEERFLVASGVFYRRATNDLREDGRRNRHIALAISRASSGSR